MGKEVRIETVRRGHGEHGEAKRNGPRSFQPLLSYPMAQQPRAEVHLRSHQHETLHEQGPHQRGRLHLEELPQLIRSQQREEVDVQLDFCLS